MRGRIADSRRPIYRVHEAGCDGGWWCVGRSVSTKTGPHKVTRIVAYHEPGEMAAIPWIEIHGAPELAVATPAGEEPQEVLLAAVAARHLVIEYDAEAEDLQEEPRRRIPIGGKP